MNSTKTVKGRHVETRQGVQRTHEDRLKIKVQDLNFLMMKGQAERKKIEQMQSSLQLLDEEVSEAAPRKHVIFADSEEEARNFDACKHFKTVPELLHRSYNRLTSEQLGDNVILNKKEAGLMTRADMAQRRAYEELNQRVAREDMVKSVDKKLRTHKMLMGAGRRVKIVTKDEFGDEIKEKTVWKFKTERKK
jgi:U3 small nucleolar RNA-associated protein 11